MTAAPQTTPAPDATATRATRATEATQVPDETTAPRTTPTLDATTASDTTPVHRANPAALVANTVLANTVLANTVLAITVLALAIRLIDLGGASLWFDELLEYERATGTWRETLMGRGIDQDPPLFALFNRLWFAIIPAHSEFWLRFPSALAGSAAVWLVGRWSGARFGPVVGILSALFMAIAPVHVHYARELNQYVWMTLIAVVAIIAWERVRRSWKGRDWVAYGVVSALALLTHYGLAFPLAVMGIDLSLGARRRSKSNLEAGGTESADFVELDNPPRTPEHAERRTADRPPRPSWRPLVVYIVVIGVLVTSLMALGLSNRLDTGHVQKRWGGTHLQKEIDYILDTGWREVLVFFFLPFAGGTALPIVRALSLLSLAGIIDLWRRAPAGKRIFGGLLGGTLSMTYVASVFGLYPLGFRYGLFNAPLLLVALAGGVAWAGRTVGRLTARLAVTERHPATEHHPLIARPSVIATTTTLATLTALIAAAFVAFWPHEWWDNPHLSVPREHGREVAAVLDSTAEPGDAIYVYHAAAPAFRYYGLGAGAAGDLSDRASIVWGRPFDSRSADEAAREAELIETATESSSTGRVLLYFVHVNAAERSALHVALDDGPLMQVGKGEERGGNAVVEVWIPR